MISGDDPTVLGPPLPLPEGVPPRVGRYRVLRALGQGGMGVVLLALDEALGREVALKLIASSGESSATERARFDREARAAARLNHPNIAAVYDVGAHEGQPYLAMEYVAGETLADRLRRGPLPLPLVNSLAAQLAAALASAHAAEMVHRDLKPGNVLVRPDGTVKLVDFGLARPSASAGRHDEGPITQTGAIVGTPAYMSPEQAMGRPVGAASDVFSLGTLLYECLAGTCPFVGDSVFALLTAVVSHAPVPIAAQRADVPASLAQVLTRCLAKDPGSRPSAAEVLDAVAGAPRSSTSEGSVAASEAPLPPVTVVPGRVALMPFANRSGNPDHEWVGAGLTDTLGHELRRSSGVTLVAEGEVAALIGALDSTRDVGIRTRAEWVVKGAYQVAGPRLRITCSALHVVSDEELSCDRVDGALDDIFELQDHVITAVRRVLDAPRRPSAGTLAPGERGPAHRQAYELYSRGLVSLRSNDASGAREAAALFAEAIRHDPGYALAHAGLGFAEQLGFFLDGRPLDRAREHLERALELDPRSASAHAWISQVHMFQGNYPAGIHHGERATELEPTFLDGWLFLGFNHAYLTLAEGAHWQALALAIDCWERGVRVAPHYASIHHNVGLFYMLVGDLERADHHYAICHELTESGARFERWPGGRAYQGIVALFRGDLARAAPLLEEGIQVLGREDHLAALPMLAATQLALAETSLRRADPDAAEAGYEAVRALAEAASGAPGIRHFRLRAHLGLCCVAVARGDAEGASRRLALLEPELADATLRRDLFYDAFVAGTFYDAARTYACLGRADAALTALGDAVTYGMLCAPRYDTDSAFDALRARSAFVAARERMSAFRREPG